MKQLLGLIFVITMTIILFKADAGIPWCVKVYEWFIGFIVWGLLILAVLWVINFFLSMLD